MIMTLMPVLLGMFLAPILPGLVNRTKAVLAGRNGPPLLQLWFDIMKLLQKGAVYSRTATWVVRAGPIVGLAALLVALDLLPFGSQSALLSFNGDLIVFAYLLGLARFFTVIAAMDTGSAFEGMGSSREVFFSMLAEPGLILSLAALCRHSSAMSLSALYPLHDFTQLLAAPHIFALVAAALFIVFLAENARVPVDDPNTHLELTMIHEVMVLDHGGPDFAFILYGAALKFWILGSLLTGLLLPFRTGSAVADLLMAVLAQCGLAIAVGVVESMMARIRLLRVTQFLVASSVFAAIALGLLLR
ncbi:MAG: NADH-quinone oxidoreductase subunit H [Candidatus Hydrogenedentota bacterium]